jgi:D-alanyl-lipoteichoic acid acyltransferase DltB (MBOAT superfamily)
MFGIKLPINFFSPYRATSIVDFWRRWHITLSRFLRDYLYIPLGGNQYGKTRRFGNLMATMILGGLWHGASWNFVLWGALHGAYLSVNHLWQLVRGESVRGARCWHRALIGWTITFAAVTIAWVPFRAPTLNTTVSIWKSMAGLNGISLPKSWAPLEAYIPWIANLGLRFEGAQSGRLFAADDIMLVLLAGLAVVLLLPNATQFLARYRPVLDFNGLLSRGPRWYLHWHPTLLWAVFTLVMFGIAVLAPVRSHDFIYYQF